jgi:hypothetical protein
MAGASQPAPAPYRSYDSGRSAPAESDYGSDYGGDDEGAAMSEPAPVAMGMAPTAAGSPPQPILAPTPTPPPAGGTSAPVQASEGVKPLLIYRATIHLAVFEARKSIDQVEALAKELGGYLVERTDLGITVRVPAGDFDGALETISKVGDELHRQVNVQDVTAEFRDMQLRLKNLTAVRERLAALLSRAMNVDDALKVERELERIAGDIEAIKGKLKLYQELIAFSTITINFQARPAETISSEITLPFDWLNHLGLGPLLNLDN